MSKHDCFEEDGSFNINSKDFPNLINEWTSCSLYTDDEKVNKIVRAVNIHEHRETCKKKGTDCRFDFPRLPSNKTCVSKTLEKDDPDFKKKLEKSRDIKEKVKAKLTEDFVKGIDEKFTLEELLKELQIDIKDYEEALTISERGTIPILVRKVCEAYVNNYNLIHIKAWQANIDIQICCDNYAVVSYLSEYFSKTDAGTTQKLKLALKQAKHWPDKERARHLVHTYMTFREILYCESAYRLLRSLALKGSDLKTVYVGNAIPDKRDSFLQMIDNGNEDTEEDEEEEPVEEIKSEDIITVEGRNGKFVKSSSIHDKYALRPKDLENICLAQFATTYEPSIKPKDEEFNNGVSQTESTLKRFDNDAYLPKYIELQNGKFMKARGHCSVIRLHKKKHGFEEAYGELVLYLPWRNENLELFPNDPELCVELFNDKIELVQFNHEKMLPFSSKIAEIKENLRDMEDEKFDMDIVDPAGEQADGNDLELAEPIDSTVLPPDVQINKNIKTENIKTDPNSKFKPIKQVDDHQMKLDVTSFSHEQRIAFDYLMNYCKARVMNKSKFDITTPPKRLIAHGKCSIILNLKNEIIYSLFRRRWGW